jgi:glycine hydroxymethyltransferase
MHAIAGKAIAFREAATPEFKEYQKQVVKNSRALGEALVERGLKLVSGGTDNHLLLVDFSGTEMTGKIAQETLDEARITTNKNTVPFESRSPFVTSGVRLGTPTVTTRGMGEAEMVQIADLIARSLASVGDDKALAALAEETSALCRSFPLYPGAQAAS